MRYALRWSHSCPEGRVTWSLFAIREDGSFYGDVVLRAHDPKKCMGSGVEGKLSDADCRQMADLLTKINASSSVNDTTPVVGRLLERLSTTDMGMLRPLFEYRVGDEEHSDSARAFLELIKLLSPSVEGSAEFKRPC